MNFVLPQIQKISPFCTSDTLNLRITPMVKKTISQNIIGQITDEFYFPLFPLHSAIEKTVQKWSAHKLGIVITRPSEGRGLIH